MTNDDITNVTTYNDTTWHHRFGAFVTHEEAVASLDAYVARRRANGDDVTIERGAYSSNIYTRAVIVVNGTRRRVWTFGGSWRYA